MTSLGNNHDVEFTVEVHADRLILWDENAGAGADIIVPTDWDPSTWNEYVVIAFENEVQVFRAPSGTYREVAHYEQILSYDTLQEDAYAVADDRVIWGVSNNYGTNNGSSETRWRSFFSFDVAAFDVDWDFTGQRGQKCHRNPVGLLQGIACKWDGSFAVLDDAWELDVGAQFDADNIFVDSPRICFSDPVSAAARSGSIVIDWRRHEGDEATCMNYVFDSIAVFGLNMPLFKIEGGNFAGASWTTLWCNNLGNRGGPFVYTPSLATSGNPDQNVLTVGAGASNWGGSFIPNQFASTRWRKWYVVFVGGACNGNVYRIDGNSETELFLESNIESDGVLDTDLFTIFSDRFFHVFDQVFTYPRIRMTLTVNNLTPSPSEDAVRVGTVVIGKTYALPDDEWESAIITDPGVEVLEGRARVRRVREVAPERRRIELAYTGRIDQGMGVDIVRELYRHARWGVHPVAWIDDDTALTPNHNTCAQASTMSHVDPILAKVTGPMSQQRRAYSYEQQDGSYHTRNILDVGGLVLEEVL